MRAMRSFLKALTAGLLFGSVLALVVGFLGADSESIWVIPVALAAMFFGSLFDREGFWGDPHPFRRRPHSR